MSDQRDYFCEKCGKQIQPTKEHWLELNMSDGRYYLPGTVPPNESQGAFVFGPECYKKLVKQIKRK